MHLDKLLKLFGERSYQLQIAEYDKACDWAVRHGVPFVFIKGDICDTSRLTYEAQLVLLDFFHRWDGKLSFHIILGNHDFDEVGVHSLEAFERMYSKYGWFKSIHIYAEPAQKVLDGVVVNFLPYPYKERLKGKKPSVNVAHFEVNGSIRDNGGRINNDVELEDNGDTWLMGHLHTPNIMKNVFYSGTLYQLNFGESLPKGFNHCQFKYKNGKLIRKITFIENDPMFKLINLVVESKLDFKKLTKNPLHLYKLFIKNNVHLPDSLLEEYPNIVMTNGYKSKEELDVIMNESIVEFNQELESFKITDGLMEFLSTRLDKKQMKRALKIASELT